MGRDTQLFLKITSIAFIGLIAIILLVSNFKPTSSQQTLQFNLKNSKGQPVTEASFNDTKNILYFGFTHCPHICPTALAKLTSIFKNNQSIADQITPIFISVDPERDTPQRLNEYLKQFHPNIVGLTGKKSDVEALLNRLKAFSNQINLDKETKKYTFDHSTFFYLIDDENNIIEQFSDRIDIGVMENKLMAHL